MVGTVTYDPFVSVKEKDEVRWRRENACRHSLKRDKLLSHLLDGEMGMGSDIIQDSRILADIKWLLMVFPKPHERPVRHAGR